MWVPLKGGDSTVSIYSDGTSTTGTGVKGDFKLTDNNFIKLDYDNGEKELRTIMIADGDVAAIADPDREQYNKKQDLTSLTVHEKLYAGIPELAMREYQ